MFRKARVYIIAPFYSKLSRVEPNINKNIIAGLVEHAYNPSILKAKSGGLL